MSDSIDAFVDFYVYDIRRILQRRLENLKHRLASDDPAISEPAATEAGEILDWLQPPIKASTAVHSAIQCLHPFVVDAAGNWSFPRASSSCLFCLRTLRLSSESAPSVLRPSWGCFATTLLRNRRNSSCTVTLHAAKAVCVHLGPDTSRRLGGH
jgi:hypothetical protein